MITTLSPRPLPLKGRWRIEPLWCGETVFIVAGGPSLRGVNLDCLKGRKVIAVNSSYEKVPFADLLFFGDARWWTDHADKLKKFSGRIVTCSGAVSSDKLLKLRRVVPGNGSPGFAEDRDATASQRTSLQGAMNIASHLGARREVLLGADMGRASDGASHHHSKHRWPVRQGNVTWNEQMSHLKLIVEPLAKRKVEVINTSLVSRIPWWPKMSLTDFLAKEKIEQEES